MQAVILAAGKGTRMRSLTEDIAKPLLEVGGKTCIERALDQLPDEIDEVIVVIGYLGEQIREHLGDSYRSKKITYVEQKELNGTAGALWVAREFLHDRFLVMMSDDLYCRADIEACLEHPHAILVSKEEYQTEMSLPGGKVILDRYGNLQSIEEGVHTGRVHVRNANLFVLDSTIFNYEPSAANNNGVDELGLPQTVAQMAHETPVTVVEAQCWFKITTPEDLEEAERWLKEHEVYFKN